MTTTPDGTQVGTVSLLRKTRKPARDRTDGGPVGDPQHVAVAVIVVATDGSRSASAALDEALRLAGATGDQVVVVTVWRALQGDFGLSYPSAAMLEELLDSERGHAEALLDEARERGRAAGVAVETVLVTGDPAQEVAKVARERGARMIAVGTHGYGSVVAFLVGSVSAAVIRVAPCPVLVVPDPERKEPARTTPRLLARG